MHPKKIMISVWWSTAGLIDYNFFKEAEMIHQGDIVPNFHHMFKKLKIQHLALVNRKSVIFLHDDARPHVSKVTLQKLYSLNIEVLPHLPYSSDLSTTNYHFFKHIDKFLQDKVFNNGTTAEMAFEEFVFSRKSDFSVSRINKFLCCCEKCL